jgi:hypothetical protein
MYRRLIVVCFLLSGILSNLNAGVFSKLTEDHWAWTSVQSLADKGIFAKDNFNGFGENKKLSRYEFAINLSRFIAHVAQKMSDGTTLPAREDLSQLTKLCEEFDMELKLVGFKCDNLEQDILTVKGEVSKLKTDVKEISRNIAIQNEEEKVKVSGNWLVRSTWKTHRNDWTTNAFTGASQAGNSNNHAMESQIRLRLDAQIDENISMAARFRMLHKNSDSVTAVYNRNSAWGSTGIGGDMEADNSVDTAFMKIKELLCEKDEVLLGRSWYWNGHRLLLLAYLDRIQYKRKLKDNLSITANYFYDRHTGSYKDDGAVDFRGVWNLYVEKECNGRKHYLGLYAQDEPNLANRRFGLGYALGNLAASEQSSDRRRDIEFGSSGKIGRSKTWEYDASFVYTDYSADIVSTAATKNINIRQKGWQGLGAVRFKPDNQWKAKLQYAYGDDKSVGAYALVNDGRYSYAQETPYEDIARGNSWFKNGLCNMSDLKLEIEFIPKNASRHYFRIVGDWLREIKDTVSNDMAHHLAGNMNGVIPIGMDKRNSVYDTYNNLGIADPSATMLQFEYRYALSKNVNLRIGYINCDLTGTAQKRTPIQAKISAGRGFNGDYDYQLLWTELYCDF